jgi:ATP-dependent DNA helicase RecG
VPLASLRADQWACVRGTLKAIRGRRGARRGMHITEGLLADDSGNLHVVWFNQPWIADSLEAGSEVFAYGRVGLFNTRAGHRLQLESPEVEKVTAESDSAHLDRIVPVYRKLADLHPKSLRTLFHKMFATGVGIEEALPAALLREEALPPLAGAFPALHFPPDDADLDAYGRRSTPFHQRLVFEEFLGLQSLLAGSREAREALRGVVVQQAHETGDFLRGILPFHLTGAQRRVLREIFADMASPSPMYRLLHGDVGSGKTIVAFLAMAACAHQGFQAALMAPTEVLAAQQAQRMQDLLAGTGLKVAYLAGSVAGKARRDAFAGLADGSIQIAVGTHSLFQEKVEYARLALVVIDEQHRFGVEQRASLVAKGANPNVLVMTATPIPRSLAMTLYGDLDLSVLDELPPGRQPVITAVREEGSRHRVEAFLRREMDAGRQVFVIYPLVEESETLDLMAATEAFERLQAGPYRGYPAALLHGKMTAKEKDRAVRDVREGRVKLLVATTVVEVGIDLPEASAIVIEHAERFGLAQLHQLRGRVGRGGQRGYCILMHSKTAGAEALERLEILAQTRDGFAVAEADLALRGAGEPAGTRQWGGDGFRLGNPLRDFDMLERARRWAQRLADPGFPWGPGEEERFEAWASRVRSRWGSYGRIG